MEADVNNLVRVYETVIVGFWKLRIKRRCYSSSNFRDDQRKSKHCSCSLVQAAMDCHGTVV